METSQKILLASNHLKKKQANKKHKKHKKIIEGKCIDEEMQWKKIDLLVSARILFKVTYLILYNIKGQPITENIKECIKNMGNRCKVHYNDISTDYARHNKY